MNNAVDEANIEDDDEQRRNICCFAIVISKDMFNWFKVLRSLDDNSLQEMNGTDYTLYLVFLRYMAYLCGCYSILNFFLMIPIYASGKPDDTEVMDNNTDSIMDFLTVLNITGSEGKMIFTYLIALFVIPGMAVYMIHLYREKYEGWKKKVDPMEPLKDTEIAKFAIQVNNLPIDEGVETLQRRIHANMLKIYPPDPVTNKSPFVKARVLGNYDEVYNMCVELKRNVDILENVRQVNQTTGVQ